MKVWCWRDRGRRGWWRSIGLVWGVAFSCGSIGWKVSGGAGTAERVTLLPLIVPGSSVGGREYSQGNHEETVIDVGHPGASVAQVS